MVPLVHGAPTLKFGILSPRPVKQRFLLPCIMLVVHPERLLPANSAFLVVPQQTSNTVVGSLYQCVLNPSLH